MFALDRRLVAILTEQPDNPAAGEQLIWPNPEDTRILIVSVILDLDTDSTAANRRLTLVAHKGDHAYGNSPAPGHEVADEDITYFFSACVLGIDESADLSTMWGVISHDFYLDPDDQLRTNLINIQVGDQIDNITIAYQRAMAL